MCALPRTVDIVARVFHLKKEALLKKLKDKDHPFFGEMVADVYTIEFQKRGLPHIHILIFLREDLKIRDVAMVDAIVRAELPDPVTEPLLYATITKCMLHGPFIVTHKYYNTDEFRSRNVATFVERRGMCRTTVLTRQLTARWSAP